MKSRLICHRSYVKKRLFKTLCEQHIYIEKSQLYLSCNLEIYNSYY